MIMIIINSQISKNIYFPDDQSERSVKTNIGRSTHVNKYICLSKL